MFGPVDWNGKYQGSHRALALGHARLAAHASARQAAWGSALWQEALACQTAAARCPQAPPCLPAEVSTLYSQMNSCASCTLGIMQRSIERGKEAAVQRSACALTPQLECWMQQFWPDWVRPGSQEAGRVKLLAAGRPCWQPRLHAAGGRACAGPLDLPLQQRRQAPCAAVSLIICQHLCARGEDYHGQPELAAVGGQNGRMLDH